jgi:hypothetical protein
MRSRFAILKFIFFYISLSSSSKAEYVGWWKRDFRSPAPHFVKMSILETAKNVDVWVETGTYMGQTTEVLSRDTSRVISIEPSLELAQRAKLLFAQNQNVQIVNGLSENELPSILEALPSDSFNVAFWLDGHYSEGPTHLGPIETPIVQELRVIEAQLEKFQEVTIFIDDFRCFVNRQTDYPQTSFLSTWADSNGMSWSVEHDIFIARKTQIGI